MNFLTRLLDHIMHIVSWFLILILGIMSIVLFISVLCRYLLDYSIHWADPVARYGQVWIMLLGSTLALRKGLHIGVDNFVNMLPVKLRTWVLRFNILLILFFSVTMTYQGFKLIHIAKGQLIPEMGIPMGFIYYMIPAAGAILVLTSVEMLTKRQINSITTTEGEDIDG